LLEAWSGGDQAALDRLIPLVYGELKRVARRYLRREHVGHTLQTTDLVNEVYLRLVGANTLHWSDRAHFFAVASQLMRRILVDFARRRQQLKRGGGIHPVSLTSAEYLPQAQEIDLVELDRALTELAGFAPRQCRVVELRFFAGLTEAEAAAVLNISPRTVRNDWAMARAWLLRALRKDGVECNVEA
jgi:RNA polymerase sigma factor (TIGR02999 family)